ncbi:MAG: hypothetical protein BWY91_00324 [bacterium ADurb.BinA028]|nr:MAG: hypothetical protein BWY91_00324 [bacterium ADurb.BinA028]
MHGEHRRAQHDCDERQVAQHPEPRLTVRSAVGRQVGQPGGVPRSEAAQHAGHHEDAHVCRAGVHDERRPAHDRAQRDAAVGHGTQIGLELHASPADRHLGGEAIADRVGGGGQGGLDRQQQGEHPRRGCQHGQRRRDREGEHDHVEHLAGAAGVAQMPSGKGRDHRGRGCHRDGQRHLPDSETQVASEVDGRGRHHRTAAEAGRERSDGQDAQLGIEGYAASRQRLTLACGGHRVPPPSILTSRYFPTPDECKPGVIGYNPAAARGGGRVSGPCGIPLAPRQPRA